MSTFPAFYTAVHGRKPFRWQERLANQVLAEGWPEEGCIGPPTASGKTSVIDIAVFALAMQSGRSLAERTAPIRTFFVVDRRLVVDDVTKHAQDLQNALRTSPDPAIVEVRERLCSFGVAMPLQVQTLRGGMYRSSAWADRPNQPLVCISTVDQIGSRLLFRGYGTSERRRPVDAGLAGCDALIILDEAHLSQPFLETIRNVQGYSKEATEGFPGVRFISMSATAPSRGFALTAEDYEDERLAPRLKAEKIATLRETGDLENNAAKEAQRLMKERGGVVGVVVNTVNGARAIYEELEKEAETILLTGRVRPFDRDQLIENYLDRMRAGRKRRPEDRLFVVATQTIEVGADLDFDALVTEAAPLDALRQRFGRLDRLGDLGRTSAVILKRKRRKGESDPVYGEPAEAAWEWLHRHVSEGAIDFGAAKMGALYESKGESGLNAAAGEAPLMFPAHVETWVQTCPSPGADPEIAPFLHGMSSGSAEVQLVWRADLDIGDWDAILDLVPPAPAEALPLPIWTAKSWLERGEVGNTADIEGVGEEASLEEGTPREFLIWRGPEKKDHRRGIDEIRPGDTIVLRSNEGGCDRFGWNPESAAPVKDIGDDAWNQRVRQAGGRFRIRMHPGVVFPDDAERRDKLRRKLGEWRDEDETASDWLKELAQGILNTASNLREASYGRQATPLYQTPWFKADADESVEEMEDDVASLRGDRTLTDHTAGVVDHVRKFAGGCGISGSVLEALVLAAELHDAGKADDRFQILLERSPNKPLRAKGRRAFSRQEYEQRRAIAGYPKGARHEFWSVALAESANGAIPHDLRDLVLYLIGTHHGYGRPFAPVWEETGAAVQWDWGGVRLQTQSEDVRRIAKLGSGWVDRFWRLNQRFGYWGLAYLEAVLRRADCVQSRIEEVSRGDD